MLEFKITVNNSHGVHLTTASAITQLSMKFPDCKAFIKKGDIEVDARSLMTIVTLEALCGDELVFQLDGESEQDFKEAIEQLNRDHTL